MLQNKSENVTPKKKNKKLYDYKCMIQQVPNNEIKPKITMNVSIDLSQSQKQNIIFIDKTCKHQQCKASQIISPIIEDDEREKISHAKVDQKRASAQSYIPKEKSNVKVEDDVIFEQDLDGKKNKLKSVVNTERTSTNNKNVIFTNIKGQNNSLMNQYNKNNYKDDSKKNPIDVLKRPVNIAKGNKDYQQNLQKEEIKLYEFNDYSSNDGRAQKLPDTHVNKFPQSEG